jgi:hypothetical protein
MTLSRAGVVVGSAGTLWHPISGRQTGVYQVASCPTLRNLKLATCMIRTVKACNESCENVNKCVCIGKFI